MKEALRRESFKVSEAMVEPTRQVVKVAIARVRAGDVDSLERQKIGLMHEYGVKLYEVTDIQVEQTNKGVISKGNLDVGLFILEINLNEFGEPVDRGLHIQTPRSEKKVNTRSIYTLRQIPPETMSRLASELIKAKIIPLTKYQEASSKL